MKSDLPFYVDTSVLAACYCPEPLSGKAEALLRKHGAAISSLTEVEFFSAVAKKLRMGGLSTPDASRVVTQFTEHMDAGVFERVTPEARHYDVARDWIGRFNLPLRTLDALHLAIAGKSGLPLLTSDKIMAKAASHFGVRARLLK